MLRCVNGEPVSVGKTYVRTKGEPITITDITFATVMSDIRLYRVRYKVGTGSVKADHWCENGDGYGSYLGALMNSLNHTEVNPTTKALQRLTEVQKSCLSA